MIERTQQEHKREVGQNMHGNQGKIVNLFQLDLVMISEMVVTVTKIFLRQKARGNFVGEFFPCFRKEGQKRYNWW